MVDWQGLFNWSVQYHDGTAPSDFAPMKEEDKKWLEEAMNQHTYSDVDRLKEICDNFKEDIDSEFKKNDHVELLDLLDECQELTEIHERNNLNLCICGGLNSILTYMLKHPDAAVRKASCHLFSACVQNNAQVQQFAKRFGALNMMSQFCKEEKIENREAAMGAISSFLRADNFNSKREFIGQMGGLQFLAQTLNDKKNSSVRLTKKTLMLMYDLALNDEGIFEDQPTMVRKCYGDQMEIINRLMEILVETGMDLENGQLWDLRETVLRILFRVFQVCPQKLEEYNQLIVNHNLNLAKRLQVCPEDHQALVMKEMELVEKVLKAPSLPIEVNYTKKTAEQKVMQGLTGPIKVHTEEENKE